MERDFQITVWGATGLPDRLLQNTCIKIMEMKFAGQLPDEVLKNYNP